MKTSKAEIEQFLTALAVKRKVAASTQNQALAAVPFLYKEVMQRDPGWLDDVVRSPADRLPAGGVLTCEPRSLAHRDGPAGLMKEPGDLEGKEASGSGKTSGVFTREIRRGSGFPSGVEM
jgi:Phage integrase, N-terminal SAM-like domain